MLHIIAAHENKPSLRINAAGFHYSKAALAGARAKMQISTRDKAAEQPGNEQDEGDDQNQGSDKIQNRTVFPAKKTIKHLNTLP